MKGYIYVLSNPSMPGLVKIGRSIHGGGTRAKQLKTTGVPQPFVVEFEMMFEDASQSEVRLHEALEKCRVDSSSEFFRISPGEAARYVVEEWLFWSDLASIVIDSAVGLRMVSQKARELCVPEFELCQAIEFVEDRYLMEGLDRALEKRASTPYDKWGNA